MAVDFIEGFFTDRIESVGNVRRIYFQALVVFDDGHKEWHYYGTTLAEVPARTTDPAFEHTYVQFPQAMDDIPKEDADQLLYELGQMSGFRREGLT